MKNLVEIDDEGQALLKEKLMENKIAHINTLGIMKLKENFKLYVDDERNPGCYLMRREDWNIINEIDRTDPSGLIKNIMKELISRGGQKFSGVLYRFYDTAKKISEVEFYEVCYLYYLPPEKFEYENPRHEVLPLKEKEAEIIARYHPYSEEEGEAIDRIKNIINKLPALTVRNEEGDPVSWALLREDGSMGMAHTIKEYRRQGMAESITKELIRETIDRGLTPYVHIVTDNTPSISLVENLGFLRYHERAVWFGIE